MKFPALTEDQIDQMHLLPAGQYQANVFDAIDTDKYGNPLLTHGGVEKIDLVLHVYDEEGKTHVKRCALTPAFPKILKHFCDVADLQEKYKNQDLNADDCKGVSKTFLVDITHRTYKNKEGKDVTTNNINDFLPLASGTTRAKVEDKPFVDDKDIPW